MQASKRVDVVVVVLDGLRPDMVTADVMPTLAAFADRATTFSNARSVFPSVTATAAASLTTGMLPGRHGISGSEVYWPSIAPDRIIDLSDYRMTRGAHQAMPGGILHTQTLGDALAAAGRKVAVVDAGAPVASTLLNPNAGRHAHWTFSTVDRLATPTPSAWDDVVARFGFPPERELPRFDEIRYATTVMIDHVLADLAPSLAVLWLSEPDVSSRYREIGSLETENALRQADRQFARLLEAIDSRQGLESTLVIVTSDHGQISSSSIVDVCHEMRHAGFEVAGDDRIDGASVVYTGRGYGSLTAAAGGTKPMGDVARWLLEQPWVANVLMSGSDKLEGPVPGTLSTRLGGLLHEDPNRNAPAIYFTFAADEGLDRHGVAGRGQHAAAGTLSRGTHGGLNRFEMSTLLMIAGPGFSPGVISSAVAGVVDIAPTVLAHLGLPAIGDATGRNLARLSPRPRQTIKVETRNGSRSQFAVVADVGGMRLEYGGRSYEA
jgi:phosphonoacetate hydrolase